MVGFIRQSAHVHVRVRNFASTPTPPVTPPPGGWNQSGVVLRTPTRTVITAPVRLAPDTVTATYPGVPDEDHATVAAADHQRVTSVTHAVPTVTAVARASLLVQTGLREGTATVAPADEGLRVETGKRIGPTVLPTKD